MHLIHRACTVVHSPYSPASASPRLADRPGVRLSASPRDVRWIPGSISSAQFGSAAWRSYSAATNDERLTMSCPQCDQPTTGGLCQVCRLEAQHGTLEDMSGGDKHDLEDCDD
jgi:hypothetical protein